MVAAPETIGASGFCFGAATIDAAALTQPLRDCVAVYVPGTVTLMSFAVEPLLQRMLPAAVADSSVRPHSSLLLSTGAAGAVLGEATPEPAALTQPFTDCVTV